MYLAQENWHKSEDVGDKVWHRAIKLQQQDCYDLLTSELSPLSFLSTLIFHRSPRSTLIEDLVSPFSPACFFSFICEMKLHVTLDLHVRSQIHFHFLTSRCDSLIADLCTTFTH